MNLIEAEQRPWIAIEATPASPFYFDNGEAQVKLDICLRNLGKKVATDMISEAVMYTGARSASERAKIIENAHVEVTKNQAKAEYNRRIVLPGQESKAFQGVYCPAAPREEIYRVIVYLEYKIAGEGDWKYGWAGFDLLRAPGGVISGIRSTQGTVPQQALRLVASGIGDAN